MSFWFSPTRTKSCQKDLHETDVVFLQEVLGTDHITFGNKGMANVFCDILPGFNECVSKWASPDVIENWGNLLLKMCYHLHDYHSEKEFCNISWYGSLFVKIGQRGIGLHLSW